MRNYKALAVPSSVWRKPSHFIAFGFGSGAMPFAPGTFGTLMAIPFYLALSLLLPNTLYLIAVIFITLASMWLCDIVTNEIKVQDHSGMCLDEIVGYLVTMCYAPHGWQWILLGFVLFRLFDIWKPWPISYVDQKVHGGIGIILDDALAGIVSLIILQIIKRLVI